MSAGVKSMLAPCCMNALHSRALVVVLSSMLMSTAAGASDAVNMQLYNMGSTSFDTRHMLLFLMRYSYACHPTVVCMVATTGAMIEAEAAQASLISMCVPPVDHVQSFWVKYRWSST